MLSYTVDESKFFLYKETEHGQTAFVLSAGIPGPNIVWAVSIDAFALKLVGELQTKRGQGDDNKFEITYDIPPSSVLQGSRSNVRNVKNALYEPLDKDERRALYEAIERTKLQLAGQAA